MYRLIDHTLNFNPDDPIAEQHRRLACQHLQGDEEEAAEAEYNDLFDDTSEEGDD